ncbi:tyrosine-protein kinase receptor torso-like [Epargyreus clarus]|uniref:tyrosine-protein kinase receptor torso-like n=1 Tax=Epargyreus clarus TaxID=520877 RepID=UPI003C2C98AF
MIQYWYIMFRSFERRMVLVTFFAYTTLCVIAGPLKVNAEWKKDFPVHMDQGNEKKLAEDVCEELEVTSRLTCKQKFLEHGGNFGEPPPELQIRCQSKQDVWFSTTPTKSSQVVVLLNEETQGEPIIFSVIGGSESSNNIINYLFTGELERNFTFWTTVVDKEGAHSAWRKGPVIQPWAEVIQQLEEKEYYIKIEFLFASYQNETHQIKAMFSWNTSDVLDSCFYVTNTCNKQTLGNFFQKSIKPNDEPWVIVGQLPLDDACTFTVEGKYGTTSLAYHTPECYQLPGCEPLPVEIKLNISTIEDDDGLWKVEVQWEKPKYDQDLYIVTLFADNRVLQNITVHGNSTKATFRGVGGTGSYKVEVIAVLGSGRSFNIGQGFIPVRIDESEGMVIGLAWMVALLGALGAAALASGLLSWRRWKHDKQTGQYYAGLKDMSINPFSDADTAQDLIAEDQWEIRPERMLLHEVIGEGAFGVVRRATLLPGSREVAVKMLKDFPSTEEVRSFVAEAELMKSVGAHPHVVSLLGFAPGRRPLLVAEYCARGDLLSFLRCAWDMMVSKRNVKYHNNNKEIIDYRNDLFKDKEMKEPPKIVVNRLYDLQGVCDTELTNLDLLSFCRQIAMGMEFLAANRVVHRDLAARNVLVTADRTLKIADFGLSRDVYQENQYKQKGNGKIPIKWMALESLTHRVYTTQSDVWSFGVVMWEVATLGGAPYASVNGARLPRLLRAGYRMPRPPACDPQLYELMLECWHERPLSRPTFPELHARLDALLAACAHPYLPLSLPPPADELHRPASSLRAPHRYVRMLLRGEHWPRTPSYERPAPAAATRLP